MVKSTRIYKSKRKSTKSDKILPTYKKHRRNTEIQNIIRLRLFETVIKKKIYIYIYTYVCIYIYIYITGVLSYICVFANIYGFGLIFRVLDLHSGVLAYILNFWTYIWIVDLIFWSLGLEFRGLGLAISCTSRSTMLVL